MVVSSLDSVETLLKEVDVLSTCVEHKFSTVVLSDCIVDTIVNRRTLGGDHVMSDSESIATPLSAFLAMTDLAGQHLLLHPARSDMFACLQHYIAHKHSNTSAIVVLPKQPGMWRKFLRGA